MIRFSGKAEIIITEDFNNDVLRILQEEQVRKVGLILDENISAQNDVAGLVDLLNDKFTLINLKIKAVEPTTDMVNDYTAALRDKNIDIFVGIGGGSIIDLTKALSVMVVNEGIVEDYHGTGKAFSAGVKKILIPTTAGTGSEVTPGAVLVNKLTKFKRAIGGKYVNPDYAILNARLTLGMPDTVIASTGMDALGHAVESYTAKCANEITRMYSKEAFRLIFDNLPKIFDDKENIDLRNKLLLGSCLAGYAIYNSNTGACHSLAYPLGIYQAIPHGVAVSHLLPKVVRINYRKGCYLYVDLYNLLDKAQKLKDRKDAAERFCSLLENYLPLNYLGKNFSDYGVNENNYEFLAERGLDLAGALNNNPVEFTLKDAKEVLHQLIGKDK